MFVKYLIWIQILIFCSFLSWTLRIFGSYLSVDDFVPAQRARLSEAFSANFTHKRPRAGVNGHVARQVVVRVKHLKKRHRHTSAQVNIYRRQHTATANNADENNRAKRPSYPSEVMVQKSNI